MDNNRHRLEWQPQKKKLKKSPPHKKVYASAQVAHFVLPQPHQANPMAKQKEPLLHRFISFHREIISTTTYENISKQAGFGFVNNKSAFSLVVSLILPYFTSNKIDSNTIRNIQ